MILLDQKHIVMSPHKGHNMCNIGYFAFKWPPTAAVMCKNLSFKGGQSNCSAVFLRRFRDIFGSLEFQIGSLESDKIIIGSL